jgi:hypothetical protein
MLAETSNRKAAAYISPHPARCRSSIVVRDGVCTTHTGKINDLLGR